MAVVLDGGCRVSTMNEGTPHVLGSLKIWNQVGKATGADAISLRVLEFGPGVSPGLRNRESDEVFYVLESLSDEVAAHDFAIVIDGDRYEIGAQTGVYLRPGQTLSVENPGPGAVRMVSSQCPEEMATDPQRSQEEGLTTAVTQPKPPLVKLSDRRALPTADRWYRVLVDDEIGSEQVTQFVGSIPPGRAPDHFHEYEEVLFILRGEGRMWAGETNTPIAAGSCIYLPKRQLHCVENTGPGELRLLGVFYPAGSPAVRY
ncbi:MAG TPA: cupin domain-containing protein [Pyrinomonadaceae bacterium]|nr:cupin domain-containing protein [Pyrinomonadaceae bacterium]